MEHYYLCPSDHLAHHGVTGMKWGVMHGPPYPLARTSAGGLDKGSQLKRKMQAAKSDYAIRMKQKKLERDRKRIAKQEIQSLALKKKQLQEEAARNAKKKLLEDKIEKAKDEKEALKQYVREHPMEITKYADAFTDEEMYELVHRIDLDKSIRKVRDSEVDRYMKYVNDTAKIVKDVSITVSTTSKAFDAINSLLDKIPDAINSSNKSSQNTKSASETKSEQTNQNSQKKKKKPQQKRVLA